MFVEIWINLVLFKQIRRISIILNIGQWKVFNLDKFYQTIVRLSTCRINCTYTTTLEASSTSISTSYTTVELRHRSPYSLLIEPLGRRNQRDRGISSPPSIIRTDLHLISARPFTHVLTISRMAPWSSIYGICSPDTSSSAVAAGSHDSPRFLLPRFSTYKAHAESCHYRPVDKNTDRSARHTDSCVCECVNADVDEDVDEERLFLPFLREKEGYDDNDPRLI